MTSTWTLFNENSKFGAFENVQRMRWAIAHLQLKKLRDVWKGDVERKLRSRKVGPIITCTNLRNITATTAAAKKAGSCQILPCLHPSSVRNFLSRGCTRFWCSGGLFARLRAKSNEVKTVAQIITHLYLHYDPVPPQSAPLRLGSRSLFPDFGRPFAALAANCPTSGKIVFRNQAKMSERLDLRIPSNPPPPPTFSRCLTTPLLCT